MCGCVCVCGGGGVRGERERERVCVCVPVRRNETDRQTHRGREHLSKSLPQCPLPLPHTPPPLQPGSGPFPQYGRSGSDAKSKVDIRFSEKHTNKFLLFHTVRIIYADV